VSGINLAPGETGPARIVAAIRQMMQGRNNAAGTCTLLHGAASTTVTAPNCAAGSSVFLFPATAHAGAELAAGGCFVPVATVANGSFKITHANNSQTDREFYFVCLG
jgi:hypothetical protein